MPSIDRSGTFRLGDRTVRRLGYGAMQLAGPGVFGPPKDRASAVAVLREAVAAGVNHIDTSDFYGPHVTNQIIKEALSPYPEDLVIVTKISARRDEKGAWLPALSPAELTQAVHDNLRNLGLDVLEIVNFRSMYGVEGPGEGSIEAPLTVFADLQRQGLIRHLGLSNVNPAQLAEGRRICEIVCVQNHYNLAHRGDDPLIDALAQDGIPYVPFFPLGRLPPSPVGQARRGRRPPRRHAHADRTRLAAAPLAQHPAHPRHVLPCAPAREPRRGGAGAAGRCDGRPRRDCGCRSRLSPAPVLAELGRKDVDPGSQFAIGGADLRHDLLVAGAFERVEPGPVIRQLRRLEQVNPDLRPERIERQARGAERRAPAGIRQSAAHRPCQPPPVQSGELMVVDPARGQSPVGGKSRVGRSVLHDRRPPRAPGGAY